MSGSARSNRTMGTGSVPIDRMTSSIFDVLARAVTSIAASGVAIAFVDASMSSRTRWGSRSGAGTSGPPATATYCAPPSPGVAPAWLDAAARTADSPRAAASATSSEPRKLPSRGGGTWGSVVPVRMSATKDPSAATVSSRSIGGRGTESA